MMFSDVKSQLSSAEILPGHRHHRAGAITVRELLRKGSISDDAYYNLVGVDIGKTLLKTNVFTMHVNSRRITFQSAVTKQFCEENSALWVNSGLLKFFL
jgi:hypothetical protein